MIQASYSGDSTYSPTSSSLTETISAATPSLTLGTSANPSVFGQPLTLTLTVGPAVAGAAVPTGSVYFTDTYNGTTQTINPKSVSYSTVNGNLVATLALPSPLAPGANTITAYYSGDNFFYAAASAQVFETVNIAAPQLSLTSDTNPAAYGETPTLSFTIAPAYAGSPRPTGTVYFTNTYHGVTQTLTGANYSVRNGDLIATLPLTNPLAPGAHTITAYYSGDNFYYKPASAQLVENVTTAAPILALTSSANPAYYGQTPTTFTLTVNSPVIGAAAPVGTGTSP